MIMKKQKVKIGYEIKTGKEIDIPMAHTVITGLTQESGKTTCIMGLVKRSGLKALIIKTKIGEKAVTEGSILPPFYKEDFDKGINEMIKNGLMKKDTHGNFFGNLREKITQECSAMKITDQEAEQLYNHILMEMLK